MTVPLLLYQATRDFFSTATEADATMGKKKNEFSCVALKIVLCCIGILFWRPLLAGWRPSLVMLDTD